MDRERGKWSGAAVAVAGAAALAAGYLAMLLLRPGGELVDPVPVTASNWFEAGRLQEMLDFREPQRLIGLGLLAAELIALGAIAYWAPPRLAGLGRRRPVAAAAAVGAGTATALAVLALPFGMLAAARARDAGLLTQPIGAWLGDRLASEAIGIGIAAVGAAVAIFLIRRLRGLWWMAGTGLVVVYAVLVVWLWPVLVSPLFADFEPLGEGQVREEVLSLAERADVEVGEVLVSDAGERSTAISAYVTGLGATKRVVISDNAIEKLEPEARRAVVAHELAHVRSEDVRRALAWIVLVAPLGVLFVQAGGTALARARGVDPASPAAIPALALCLSVAVVALGVPANHLSRSVEARADHRAMQLTGEPEGMIELQRRLASANLSDPDPPAALHYLRSSHPSTTERIGAALAFAEEIGLPPPDPGEVTTRYSAASPGEVTARYSGAPGGS